MTAENNDSSTVNLWWRISLRRQKSGCLSTGKTLDGINYCINQEDAIRVFLNDGEVLFDNNATEGGVVSVCTDMHGN